MHQLLYVQDVKLTKQTVALLWRCYVFVNRGKWPLFPFPATSAATSKLKAGFKNVLQAQGFLQKRSPSTYSRTVVRQTTICLKYLQSLPSWETKMYGFCIREYSLSSSSKDYFFISQEHRLF